MIRRFFLTSLISLSLTLTAQAAPLNPSSLNDRQTLQQQAKQDPYAQAVLALAYSENLLKSDSPKQVQILQQAVNKSTHPLGLFTQCVARFKGYKVPVDRQQAESLCSRALPGLKDLAKTDLNAMYSLGYMAYYGLGIPENDQQALSWFSQAADKGHVMAMCYVGYMFDEAIGVEEDDEKAVNWYQRSAQGGYLIAQYNLGLMYRDGTGIEQDQAKAMHWFRQAADLGDQDAQYELGMAYRDGRGLERDWSEAIKWLTQSAQQGVPEAQFSLGMMYRDGLGVQVDHSQALKWLQKAADQDHPTAQSMLENLK